MQAIVVHLDSKTPLPLLRVVPVSLTLLLVVMVKLVRPNLESPRNQKTTASHMPIMLPSKLRKSWRPLVSLNLDKQTRAPSKTRSGAAPKS